ncbi:MAG: ferritin family protein [Verrucomicrobiaceae bacterium]
MNVQRWIDRFQGNSGEEEIDWDAPVELGEREREALAGSLAIFQLGESGEGATLFRYAERVAKRPGFEDYPEGLRLFIEEEHRHARMLGKMVERLGGELISKQWSDGVFRKVRKLINLEFHVQMFMTAEIIAEAYYDLLRCSVEDFAIRKACARILSDEVGHLGFHASFFKAWLREKPGWVRRGWRVQFCAILEVTKWVVWIDHRRCFGALGVSRERYLERVGRARRSFLARVSGGRDERGEWEGLIKVKGAPD